MPRNAHDMLCWQSLIFGIIAQRLYAREAGKGAHFTQAFDQDDLPNEIGIAIGHVDRRDLKILGYRRTLRMTQHFPLGNFQVCGPDHIRASLHFAFFSLDRFPDLGIGRGFEAAQQMLAPQIGDIAYALRVTKILPVSLNQLA